MAPFAHGVPPKEIGDGFFDGAQQYKYMRALYGLSVSTVFGVTVALFTKPPSEERQRGLVWGTQADALAHYKGSPGTESASAFVAAALKKGGEVLALGSGQLPAVVLSSALATSIEAEEGDIIFVTDARWWLGGLRASHGKVHRVEDDGTAWAQVSDEMYGEVLPGKVRPVKVQRLY